jgi:hypothetical protein
MLLKAESPKSKILATKDSFYRTEGVVSKPIIVPGFTPTGILSIMIPTYNRLELLKESVHSAVNQTTNQPYNIIIVDNNTDTKMASEVEGFVKSVNFPSISLYRNCQNIGMYANWNRCITLAPTEWLTILNDDDLLLSNFVDVALAKIKKYPGFLLYSGRVSILNQLQGVEFNSKKNKFIVGFKNAVKNLLKNRHSKLTPFKYYLANQHSGSLGIVFSRESAIRIGGFDIDYFPSADYLFWIKFSLSNRSFGYSDKVAKYRILQNECLKPDVLEGWLTQSDEMRDELSDEIGLPKWFCRLYSKSAKKELISNSISQYGDNYDINSIATKHCLMDAKPYYAKLLRLLNFKTF